MTFGIKKKTRVEKTRSDKQMKVFEIFERCSNIEINDNRQKSTLSTNAASKL